MTAARHHKGRYKVFRMRFPHGLLGMAVLPLLWGAAPQEVLPTLNYTVVVTSVDGLTVDVVAQVRGFDGTVDWVLGVEAGQRSVSKRVVSTTSDGAQQVTYTLDVAALADRHGDPDVASSVEGGTIIHDGVLLMRPRECDPAAHVTVVVQGITLWGPYARTSTGFTLNGEQLDGGAYLLLGKGRAVPVDVPGSVVEATVVAPLPRASAATLGAWVSRSAQMVADFEGGHMPFARTHLILVPLGRSSDAGVFGTTLRWGHGSIVLYLGATADEEAFKRDWVAPHELFHLTNPYLVRRLPWFTEGMTTYYGDVIRARGGTRTSTEMWDNILSGFGHACDSQSLAGLRTASRQMRVMHNYQRVYWGGACVGFIVDVALRAHTNNAQSLDTVYKALRQRSMGEDGPLAEDEIVAAFHAPFPKDHWAHAWVDAAVDRRGSMDMAQLYKRLGILKEGDGVRLTDAAQWSHVRRAIMGEPPPSGARPPASVPSAP